MNFSDLLFAFNCDPLKNGIRKIEKINKSFCSNKNCIYFYQICLKEGLHPKFCNIYIYISSYNYGQLWPVVHHPGIIIIIIIIKKGRQCKAE